MPVKPVAVGFVTWLVFSGEQDLKKDGTIKTNLDYSGNVVGYHVNVPCKTCLSQTSSRQYWMFRIPAIRASTIWLQVAEKQGDAPLLWGFVLDAAFFPPEYDRDDPEAEHKACQLAVRIPQGVRLVIREPRLMYVPAIGLVYPISASDEDLLPCR
ncbi:hypothetical protein DFQ28_000960 [Apophysomyces sp. BC1034]|nr:hypothetical protein DFQ30_008757 [Apophysomyces sp. BC1015]KAG0194241.1 hypothetical protein DFQ28_000960 [Apophysomyces sp. BC1034]